MDLKTGDRVRDKATGMTGIVMSRSEWLTGYFYVVQIPTESGQRTLYVEGDQLVRVPDLSEVAQEPVLEIEKVSKPTIFSYEKVSTVMKRQEMEKLTNTLRDELEKKFGRAHPSVMSSDWLDSVRQRVEDDNLPNFITTDYKEGWEHYARNTISSMFVQYRRKVGRTKIRGMVPVLDQILKERTWVTTRDHPEVAITHALNRLDRHIQGAVNLYGPELIALGQISTYEEVRELAHQSVDVAVDNLIKEPVEVSA